MQIGVRCYTDLPYNDLLFISSLSLILSIRLERTTYQFRSN